MANQKAVIIGGGGMVGATAAYAIALGNVVEEVVIIDRTAELAWGQAADINDATGLTGGVFVRDGDYSDIATDDIVIITAGAPQQPGQSRLDLVDVNTAIMKDIVSQVVSGGAQPFIIVVTNPVDVMTYVALKASGLPKNRVMGTGTTLDTSRIKAVIADSLGVNSKEVDAYILGEHGDSSFSTIESAQVGEVPLRDYPGFNEEIIWDIEKKIRDRAYRIIEAKKSTYYGIGQVIARIVAALRQGSHSIFPVCSLAEGEYNLNDTVIGLPSVVSRDGVRILSGYPLTERQQAALQLSAGVVKEAIDHVNRQSYQQNQDQQL